MINSSNPVLYERPKSFDGVGVNVSHNVEIMRVKNALVDKSVLVKSVIDRILVSVNACSLLNFLGNDRKQSSSLGVGDHVRFNRSVFSANNPDNNGLVFCSPSSFALAPPTKVGLVNLNSPTHRVNVFRKHHADLLAHPPSSLIGNASFPLNLFRRNPTTSLRHQVDRVEPGGQRGSGFVKDCVSRWGNLVSAVLATINLAVFNAVVFSSPTTALAFNPLRPALVSKPVKANIIGWEVVQKLFECVFIHDYSITDVLRVVKV